MQFQGEGSKTCRGPETREREGLGTRNRDPTKQVRERGHRGQGEASSGSKNSGFTLSERGRTAASLLSQHHLLLEHHSLSGASRATCWVSWKDTAERALR